MSAAGKTDDTALPEDYLTQDEVRRLNEQFNLTRGQRIRAAMFPETLELEPFSLPNLDPKKPNAIQVLSIPAQELKKAIADIINYQLDVDFTAKFLPEIAKLLADPDKDVVRNAAELTRDLTNSEAARFVMMGSQDLVGALLNALAKAGDSNSSTDRKMAEAAAGALMNLSDSERGRLTIFRCGGIAILVRLLLSPADRVVNYALTTLHGLLQWLEGSKEAVRAAGGIQNMVPLITRFGRDSRFLCVLLDALHLLCFEEAESKIAVLNNGGPKELLALYRKTTDDKLLWMASRIIRVLSACDQNKENMAENGAFGSVTARIKATRDARVYNNGLHTLRNLSDASSRLYVDDEIMQYVLSLLRLDDPSEEEILLLASGIVGNLSSDKPYLKRLIFNNDGVERVVGALEISRREDIIDPLLRTLRHLTSDMCEVGIATRNRLRNLGVIPLTVEILIRSRSWPVVKSGTGLARHLLNSFELHEAMVDKQIIPRLANIVDQATKELTRRTHLVNMIPDKQSSLRRHEPLSEDGIDLNDVLEDAISGLILLGESDPNKDPIRDTGVLEIVDLLLAPDTPSRPSDNVIEAASALKSLLPAESEAVHSRPNSMRQSERGSVMNHSPLPSPPGHSPTSETFENRFESVVRDQVAQPEEVSPALPPKGKKHKKKKKQEEGAWLDSAV